MGRRAHVGPVVPGPLEGLRVIDVGTRLAAPFCAGLLGEMGAEVVKVEQPSGGDFMRTIGPFDEGYSLFWAVEGRGRRSATLDLRKPRGQELFRRLEDMESTHEEGFVFMDQGMIDILHIKFVSGHAPRAPAR